MLQTARRVGYRLGALVFVVASLVVLVEAPLAHVVSGSPPGPDPTMPTEEEQRTEAVAGATRGRLLARTRQHAVYREALANAPNLPVRITSSPFYRATHTPLGFRGSPLALRC